MALMITVFNDANNSLSVNIQTHLELYLVPVLGWNLVLADSLTSCPNMHDTMAYIHIMLLRHRIIRLSEMNKSSALETAA